MDMENDEYDFGHGAPGYRCDGEGDLDELKNRTGNMRVNFKRLCPGARIPEYAHPGDAGMDLYATSLKIDDMCNLVYGTGIAVEIPEGYVGLVFPRSSNSKKALWLTNHVGVIDSGYRGEITFKYRPTIVEMECIPRWLRRLFKIPYKVGYVRGQDYKVGDKIGQLIIMPYPKIEAVETDFLFPGDRGSNGYGSTGE